MIDTHAAAAGDVDHVEGDDDGRAEVENLGREVEVALEVGGIEDEQDDVGPAHARYAALEDVAGDLFVRRPRGEAIDAGEIEQDGIRADQVSFALFDGDAGIISDLHAQAGEGVKEGGLSGIRVARDGDLKRGCRRLSHAAPDSSVRPTRWRRWRLRLFAR